MADGNTLLRTRVLAFVAGVGSCIAANYLYRRYWFKTTHPQALSKHLCVPTVSKGGGGATVRDFEEDDILTEQFTRNVQFFGAEGQRKVAHSFVIVVGLGGVGSHAAHLLLRSGVGKLRLIDFDQVTLSSLNRHALATRADVGMSKAKCLEDHFREILPEADVEALVAMYTAEKEQELLAGEPDFVLDAIDNVDTKVALLAACHRRGLRVLSVGAAGSKSDPTRLRIVDLSESSVDPLARAIRHRLRREHGINSGIPVVLSTEKVVKGLVAHQDPSKENLLDYQVVPGFRVRTVPVLGTTPAFFGLASAGYILTQLADDPFESEPIIQLTSHQYETQMNRLLAREADRFGSEEGVAVDADEVRYLVRELWHGLSARAPRAILPGGDKGLMRSTANLLLTRWDAARPATIDNLVMLAFDEADAHDTTPLDRTRREEPEFAGFVERQLERARREFGLGGGC